MTRNEIPPLLQDLRGQPQALQAVYAHHAHTAPQLLHEAAPLLLTAPSVVFTAMGASHFASLPLAHKLQNMGLSVRRCEASELLHYGLDSIQPHTLVVLISRSGESVEVVKLLPALKRRKARLLALTNDMHSTLAQGADLALRIGGPDDRGVAAQTYTGTLLALYLLGRAATGEPLDDDPQLDAALQAMRALVPAVETASKEWVEFLAGANSLYLIGRGLSLASAHEGALLFHETARFPALAISSGQFRHGPVEVVDASFRAVVFAPLDATRALNLALVRDLQRMGGSVRLIGPLPEGEPAWPIPETTPELAPLLEVVPLQFAAYRLAEHRGHTPGAFRWVQQVTDSETGFPGAG